MTIVDIPQTPEQPGAMQVRKGRSLPSGWTVEFESAPAGWTTKAGTPRKEQWRAYYVTNGSEKRVRVPSVSTILDAILPKPGLPPWSERQGIRGAMEAIRQGLLNPHHTDEIAVQTVRQHRLGADAARDEAAGRGINLHGILETFMQTGLAPNPADHPEPHRPFIRGLVKWLLWADPEPVAVELLVAHPDHGYAGRADLVARIGGRLTLVDLKTQERGQIYESAHVQVRLYADAERRFGEHRVDDGRVVAVDGSGSFNEMDLICSEELAHRALSYYDLVRRLQSGCEQRNRTVRKAKAAA